MYARTASRLTVFGFIGTGLIALNFCAEAAQASGMKKATICKYEKEKVKGKYRHCYYHNPKLMKYEKMIISKKDKCPDEIQVVV